MRPLLLSALLIGSAIFLGGCSERPKAAEGSPNMSDNRAVFRKRIDLSEKDFNQMMATYANSRRNLYFSLDENMKYCSNYLYYRGRERGVWPLKGYFEERMFFRIGHVTIGYEGDASHFIEVEGFSEERPDDDDVWQDTESFTHAETYFVEVSNDIYAWLMGERMERR